MLVTIDGRQVHITDAQNDALEIFAVMQNGGIGTAVEYKPTTGYVEVPTVNIQFISKFSVAKLYQRRLEALQSIAFCDVDCSEAKLQALAANDRQALFAQCMASMVESMNKTLKGDRSDAHRQAHDLFYVTHSTGVKCHLLTQDGANGRKELVLHDDGFPIVASIMLNIIEIGRKIIVPGKRKVVNSGPKVLMDHAIEKAWNKRSLHMQTLSLKADNHKCIRMGGEEIECDAHKRNSALALV